MCTIATHKHSSEITYGDTMENLTNIIDSKVADLANKVQIKTGRLAGVVDGDTSKFLGEGGIVPETIRESSNTVRYDANENEHLGFQSNKSDYAMQTQKDLAGRLFGKPTKDVTQQDMYDVANMQTVQKIADIYRNAGEPRWEAPLVSGSVKPDLSMVDAPIQVLVSDKVDANGRKLESFINPSTGINITEEAANDPRLNAFKKPMLDPRELGAMMGTRSGYKPVGTDDGTAASDIQPGTRLGIGAKMSAAPGAFVGSVIGGVAGVADFLTGGRVIGGDNVEAVQNAVGKTLGYDKNDFRHEDAIKQQLMKDTFDKVKLMSPDTYGNVDWNKAGELFAEGITDPVMLAQSLGLLVGGAGVGGVGIKAGVKLLSKGEDVINAANRSKTLIAESTVMSDIEKASKIADIDNGITLADKIGSMASKGSGALGYGATMTSQDMTEYSKNNNGELPGFARTMGMFAANTLAVAIPELATTKFALGMDKVANEKLQGMVSSAVGKALTHLSVGGIVELPQETIQAVVQSVNQKWGTDKYKDMSVTDVVNESTTDVLGQGLLGAAGGVQMASPKAGSYIISPTLQAGGEILTDKLGNSADVDNTDRAATATGRKTRFETDPTTVPTESKPAFTKDILEHASDLWLSPSNRVGTPYEKQPTAILDDAIGYLSKMYDVKSDEGKGIIEAEVAKHIFDLTNKKVDGVAVMPKEEKDSVIQTLLGKFKGNSQVEYEAEKYYKQQLEDKFQEVKSRLAQEGVNPEDLSSKGLLTKDELGNLETVLADMRRMGSEELTSVADSIGSALSARQERLGSEEGDGPKVPNKKTSTEVSAEIETLGFLTRGKKSLRDHTRDITAAINNPMLSDKELDESIGALENFVVSRNNKVNIFDTKGDAARVRSIGEIRTFAKHTMVDNDKITSTITGLLESSADKHVKSRLGDLLTSLQGTNEELKYILDSKNSRAADKALYEYLYEKQLKVFPKEKEVLDKFLKDKYGDVPTKKEGAVKIPEVTTAPVEPSHNDYIKQLEVKEAEGTLTEEELNTLTEHYSNITNDYVNNLDLSSLEDINSNEKGAVEDNSVNKEDDSSEEIDTEAVDKATNFKKKEVAPEEIIPKQNLDTHKSLLDATETLLSEANEVLKTSKEVESKLAPEYAAMEGAKRKIETVGGIKESITAMKNAIKYYQSNLNAVVADKKATMNKLAILDNSLKDHMKELDKLKAQFSKLESSIDSKSKDLTVKTSDAFKNAFIYTVALLKKAIANLKARLEKIKGKIVGKEADITDTKSNIAMYKNTIAEADKYIAEFEDAIATLKNNIESTHIDAGLSKEGRSELQQAYTTLDARRKELLAKEGLTLDEVKATRKEANALRAEVKKYKNVVETATKQAFRQDIEDVLGGAVKPNNSNKAGLSNKLFNGATAEELMEIMPNVISGSEKGLVKVEDALKYFKMFEDQRSLVPTKKQQDEGITTASLTKYISQYREEESAVLSRTGVAKLFSIKSIEDKLSKAINVAAVITLDEMISARGLQGEQLTSFVEGAFGSLWRNDYTLRAVVLPDLELMVQKGEAVPIATFYRNAGKRLLEELEIKLNLEPQDKEDAIRALGAIVIDNIYATNSGASTNKGLAKQSVGVNPTTLELETISKFTEDGKDATNKSNTLKGIKTINVRDYKFTKELNSIARVFEYAGEKSDGNIGFSPYEGHKEGDLGRNSNTPLTKKEADYLNLVGSRAWTFEGSGLKELLEQADGSVDKLVVNILGTKQDVLDSADVMDVESKIAKYESEELDIRRMMMAYDLVGDEGKFYMDWDFTVSNRAMLANKMINPQNSKISRFIVSTEGMRTEVTTEDINDVLLAMAQAFEMDPDKKADKDVVAEFRERIANIQVKDGVYVIEGELSDKLNNVLESGNTLEAIREEFGKEVSSKNIMHVYQSVELIRKIKNGEQPLKTNLALEIDGITNGMATTILQIGLLAGVKNMFKKVGAYIKGESDNVENHAEFKNSGGKDFYETPIETFQEELSTMDKSVNDLVTELIAGKWRNFLKPLVMVFAYGAGVRNISTVASKNIALKMIVKASKEPNQTKELQRMMNVFIEQVSADGELAKLVEKVSKLKTQVGKYELTNDGMLKFVETENGKLKVSDDTLNAMVEIINISISPALTTSFSKEFADITKYRQTLKVVNMLNYVASVISFKDKAKGKNYNELSEKEVRSIHDEMLKDGTYYGAANPNGGTQDYFKTQSMANTEGNVVTVNVSTSSINAYVRSLSYKGTINQIIKDLASNVGAVGVIDVHSVDGATMISGHVKDVLNIFDALVMGVGHKDNAEQARMMNEVYYQINMQHSIVGNSVNKVLSGASYKYLQNMSLSKPHEFIDLLTDFNRIFGKNAGEALKDGEIQQRMEGVIAMLGDIDEGRRVLVATPAKSNQYYVSDEYKAAEWTQEDANKLITSDARFAVYSNDDTIKNEEKQNLTDLLKGLGKLIEQSAIMKKENTKKEAGKPTGFNAKVDTILNEMKNAGC